MIKITRRHIHKAIDELGLNREDFDTNPEKFGCLRAVDNDTRMFNHFSEMVIEHIKWVQGWPIHLESTTCGTGMISHHIFIPRI